MIKRVVSFIILIALLLFAYQVAVNYFKTEHAFNYDITVDSKDFIINENYIKTQNNDYYLFKISVDNKTYIIKENNNFNKQKEVVKDIKLYDKDDVFCISLVYVNNKEGSIPLCYKDEKLMSINALKDNKLYDFTDFFKEIPYFSSKIIQSSDKKEMYEDLTIYNDYIYDNESLLIYNYKNIIDVKRDSNRMLTFSSFDDYKNVLGRLVGKYYMIPRTTSSPEYSTYYAFDITSNIIKEISLENKVSKSIYINGIYEDKLYIFDKSNLIQYSVDPYSREINVVGTEDKKGFTYQDGQTSEVTIYDLNNKKIEFSENKSKYKNIEYDEIFVFEYYAIYCKDGKFYKIYDNYENYPIFLFEEKDYKEVKVKNDNIYYMSGNIIYRYNDYGLIPLVEREEFLYNFENIYDVYIEE